MLDAAVATEFSVQVIAEFTAPKGEMLGVFAFLKGELARVAGAIPSRLTEILAESLVGSLDLVIRAEASRRVEGTRSGPER